MWFWLADAALFLVLLEAGRGKRKNRAVKNIARFLFCVMISSVTFLLSIANIITGTVIMDLKEKERLFGKEYRQLFDRLYRYVRVRINSLHDAEDIVAESILSGFKTLENYDPKKGNLEQWLIGIVRFKLFAYWKNNLSTVNLETFENFLSNELEVNTQSQIDFDIAWEKIMATVPVEFHPLFIMKFADDMTYEQIAEAVDKSPAAVRQIFSRLFRKFRLNFTEEDFI